MKLVNTLEECLVKHWNPEDALYIYGLESGLSNAPVLMRQLFSCSTSALCVVRGKILNHNLLVQFLSNIRCQMKLVLPLPVTLIPVFEEHVKSHEWVQHEEYISYMIRGMPRTTV